MSNHNYSQYSNNKKKNYNKPKVEETVEQMSVVEEETIPETVTTVAAPVEPAEVKMVVEETKSVPKPEVKPAVTGTVVNCSKLNVRSKAAIDADVLTVLEVNTEVKVDPARSTAEWLKITTTAGVDGFCMRKFVKL